MNLIPNHNDHPAIHYIRQPQQQNNCMQIVMTRGKSNQTITSNHEHEENVDEEQGVMRRSRWRGRSSESGCYPCRRRSDSMASAASRSSPSPSSSSSSSAGSSPMPHLVHATTFTSSSLSSCSSFLLLVFLLSAAAVTGLQIPDQQAYVGKVFYYRLPLTPSEMESVQEIQISETRSPADASALPDWLMVKKSFTPSSPPMSPSKWSVKQEEGGSKESQSQDHAVDMIRTIELIGVPSNQDRRMHFFHVKLVSKDGSRTDDVFVLDVMDLPSASTFEASGILGSTSFFPDPRHSRTAGGSSASSILHRERRDCILRIDPKFETVAQVWNLISELMPIKLRVMIDPSDESHAQREQREKQLPTTTMATTLTTTPSNPTALVQQWLAPLFTVNGYTEETGFRYQVTIDQQECDHEASLSKNVDDFESKLKDLRIVYHLIRIIRPNLVMSEQHESGSVAGVSASTDHHRSSSRNNEIPASLQNPSPDDLLLENNDKKKHKHHTTKKDEDEAKEEEEDDVFSDIIAPSLRDHFARYYGWDDDDDDDDPRGFRMRKHRRHAMHDLYESTPYESTAGFNPSVSTVTLLAPSSTSSSSSSTSLSPSLVTGPSLVTQRVPEPDQTGDLLPSLSSPTFPSGSLGSTTLLPDLISNTISDHEAGMTKHPLNVAQSGTPTLDPVPPTTTLAPGNVNENDVDPAAAVSITPTPTLDVSPPTSVTTLSPAVVTDVDSVSRAPKPLNPIPSENVDETTPATGSNVKPPDHQHHHHDMKSSTTPGSDSLPAVPPTTESPDSDDGDGDGDDDDSRIKTTTPVSVVSPGITWPAPNIPPIVKRRIQKLSITAGSWYKFLIPEDTFYDEEDGSTRNLKLGFYLHDSDTSESSRHAGGSGSRIAPPADHWIQFDDENQFLYALPTEKSIGKHKFVLLAVDSAGSIAEEVLQINVRQHRGSRTFHHIFSLNEVSWDPVKFPILIRATEKLLSAISNQLYGDASITALNIQKIERESRDTYTISWTNDSLPTYPCPREAIYELFAKLGSQDRRTDLAMEPSRHLKKILAASEFKVTSVGLSLSSNCGPGKVASSGGGGGPESGGQPDGPIVRNEIDLLQIRVGHVYSYKIPRDMFYSERSTDSLTLGLEMLTVDGKRLPDDGFVGFNDMTREIYALALGDPRKDPRLATNEYILLARDPDTGASVTDVFQIEFIHNEADRDKNSFEVTMTLVPNTDEEMTLERKIQLMHWLSRNVFSDPDPSSIKVLSFKRGKYAPQYQEESLVTPSPLSSSSSSIPSSDSSSSSLSGKAKRDVHSSSHQQQSQQQSLAAAAASPSSYSYYYEIIWTNQTDLVRLLDHPNCPSDVITDKVINKIFDQNLETIAKPFEPDYKLLHVSFRPLGGCVNILKSYRLGQEPVAVISLDPMDPATSTRRPFAASPPATKPVSARDPALNKSEDDVDREYYMAAIFPVLITISIMLFVALIIVCLLVKYRKSQDKARFEVITTSRTAGDAYSSERDAFLIKGRAPVIFEQEMQQQQLLSQQQSNQTPYGFYSPVIMPPPPTTSLPHHHPVHHGTAAIMQQQHGSPQPIHHHAPHQQQQQQQHQQAMNVMRSSIGRNTSSIAGVSPYQPFHQSQQHQQSAPPIPMHQRRQPPPYYT